MMTYIFAAVLLVNALVFPLFATGSEFSSYMGIYSNEESNEDILTAEQMSSSRQIPLRKDKELPPQVESYLNGQGGYYTLNALQLPVLESILRDHESPATQMFQLVIEFARRSVVYDASLSYSKIRAAYDSVIPLSQNKPIPVSMSNAIGMTEAQIIERIIAEGFQLAQEPSQASNENAVYVNRFDLSLKVQRFFQRRIADAYR